MCGIIACRTHGPAVDYLLAGLRRLEYRGYDSAGLAVRSVTGDVTRLRAVGRVAALDHAVQEWGGPVSGHAGIGHTRWATHGAVSEQNTHPHCDCSGRISLVHNGIIADCERLRHALALTGHDFSSEVDSEILCHLIEDQLAITGDLRDAVQMALTPLVGSWALAAMDQGTGSIVVAAQRSPLLIAETEHGVFASSDIAAIADWVDEFRALDDGEIIELTGDLGNHAPRLMSCGWRSHQTGLDGYIDYMAKEVDEQPAAAARVLAEVGGAVTDGSLWKDLNLGDFERMQIIGCGTSLNAGHVLANFLRRVGRVPVTVEAASEAADSIVEPNTLCLAISQSGETADVLNALADRRSDSAVIALTNNAHSTLARRADAFLECFAGPEIGVAATKTFVCQVMAGTSLMLSALVASGRVTAVEASALIDELSRIPERLAEAGAVSKCIIPSIAEELGTAGGFIFIGRGTGVPYAAEGALKLKELTYRWADHYPAGELKHGPLALIDSGTPVVVVDDLDPRLNTNVAEVAARGGRVVRIGAAGNTVPVLQGPVGPWGPLESVVPMQILARTIGLSLGWDVDKPRNLAKSVTVD
ncbi:glutamine--fructose-6-phosphate transaminase (isomerizing) [Mycobacterium sp. MS1601]|uniref:glutamine--fructose-6-phosphate transaminase (isomerizing) n=1 Tax=Mycobacterium sp. MS1601 TaxID=1936029 RepID=UPI000979806A|nr:glutamine--fructose-6-phosphate transaminase (isomerizing) [Mycobacterium sp. MS1601]AQA02550.1 glutamine--fructose-6-phosphate transaminase (isomerizing) [Mycobacterium sp. MS1601]